MCFWKEGVKKGPSKKTDVLPNGLKSAGFSKFLVNAQTYLENGGPSIARHHQQNVFN